MSSSPEETEIDLADFDRIVHGKPIAIKAGKYDWSKVINYMKQKTKAVTVSGIQKQVMPEVTNIRQIRAWMERQVKKGIMVKGTTPGTIRVFYVLREIYEDYLKNQKKTRTEA